MLPVSSNPPRAPGTELSPFGKPWSPPSGFVLPKGAWIVQTGAASVVMCVRQPYADIWGFNPARVPGTGFLPGQPPPPTPPVTGAPPSVWMWPTPDQILESFRAWQRKTGNTFLAGPPIGRQPPNWFGPWTDPSPATTVTLLAPGQNGPVLADGQNVMINGGGATIMQAYSV